MSPDKLFEAALQLEGTPWRVARSDFSGKPPVLEIELEFSRGSQFRCPQCGRLCGVHDTTPKRWRHLNFFQYRCELVANIPRVWCREDGGNRTGDRSTVGQPKAVAMQLHRY